MSRTLWPMHRSLAPVLTPHGVLRPEIADADFPLDDTVADRLEWHFGRDGGHGLLQLGAGEAGSQLPSALASWRDFAMRFIAALCAREEVATGEAPTIPAPPKNALAALIDEAPPMQGGEYLSAEVLAKLWRSIQHAFDVELAESGLPLPEFLRTAIVAGVWSGGCISTSRKTARTPISLSPSWRPTRRRSARRASCAICL